MARYALPDTNVLIRHLREDLTDELAPFARRYILRQSAVVLSELYRGASDRTSTRAVDRLARSAQIWSPETADWLMAGKLVRALGDAAGYDVHKRRELQNDCLIALTARRHGAIVLTGDIGDFRLIASRIEIEVEEI